MIFKGNVNVITRDSEDITMGYLQTVTITENGIYTSNNTKGEKRKIEDILRELKAESFVDSVFIIEGESRKTFQLQVGVKSSMIGEIMKEVEQTIESSTVKEELFSLINRIWEKSLIFHLRKTPYFVFNKHKIIINDEVNLRDFPSVWQDDDSDHTVVYVNIPKSKKQLEPMHIYRLEENEAETMNSDIRKCIIDPEVFLTRALKETD